MLTFLKSLLGPSKPSLASDVKSWGYYINGTDADIVTMAPYDLMVIDSKNENGDLFKPEEVARMKKHSKYLISYISLGEAEVYRDYWKPAWNKKKPVWLGDENPEWEGNYSVKQFWHEGWWDITTQILDQVIEAGFDGVYIDKIDVYDDLGGTDTLKAKMIDYIIRVSKYCKDKKPGFLIIAQNAEELGQFERYLNAVDGIAKESMFYSGELGAKQKPNRAADINETADRLNLFKNAGKLVLTVEYVPQSQWPALREKHKAIGYVPYCGPKQLDKLNLVS